MNLDILFEDPHILVCLKPAGIPVQSRSLSQPDLVSLLRNHLSVQTHGKRPPYLAVIHRLDQPVEGILVFAKTAAAAKKLNQQMQTKRFGKYYRALLSRTPDILEADLINPMIKDGRTNTSRICTPDTPGSKSARLHYKILQKNGGLAIAEIQLDTGRHHQIRVQMAHIGCPIVGDRKYGNISSLQEAPLFLCQQGLQLFAYRLEFTHPYTQKTLCFQIDRLNCLP